MTVVSISRTDALLEPEVAQKLRLVRLEDHVVRIGDGNVGPGYYFA